LKILRKTAAVQTDVKTQSLAVTLYANHTEEIGELEIDAHLTDRMHDPRQRLLKGAFSFMLSACAAESNTKGQKSISQIRKHVCLSVLKTAALHGFHGVLVIERTTPFQMAVGPDWSQSGQVNGKLGIHAPP
jgi:hypothetical protein